MSGRFIVIGLVAALSGFLGACQKEKPDYDFPQNTDLFAVFEDEDAEFSRLIFPDSSLSLNDRCPVRKAKLNGRMPPIYVNGHPVGFC